MDRVGVPCTYGSAYRDRSGRFRRSGGGRFRGSGRSHVSRCRYGTTRSAAGRSRSSWTWGGAGHAVQCAYGRGTAICSRIRQGVGRSRSWRRVRNGRSGSHAWFTREDHGMQHPSSTGASLSSSRAN
ncbi:hypothetical protein SEVIR_3G010301v4 [Setaria viridis]